MLYSNRSPFTATRSILVCSLGLLLAAPAAAGPWETRYEEVDSGQLGASIAARDDGSAVIMSRNLVTGPAGNEIVLRSRSYDPLTDSWSAVQAVPAPPPSGAAPAQIIGDPLLYSTEGTALDSSYDAFAGLVARYSGSTGAPLWAAFVSLYDGTGWSAWTRVSVIGRVFDADFAADGDGVIWFSYRSSDNLTPGQVFLSRWDSATGLTGPILAVDSASQRLTFRSTNVEVTDRGDVLVIYRAPDGLFMRRFRTQPERFANRVPVVLADPAPFFDAVLTDRTLWVVTDSGNTSVYKLRGNGFVQDASGLFIGFEEETDTFLRSTSYAIPAIAARPEGGVVIAIARFDHFEDFENSANDFDDNTVVVRETAGDGVYAAETTAYPDGAWNNAGGQLTGTANELWTCGAATFNRLFAASRSVD